MSSKISVDISIKSSVKSLVADWKNLNSTYDKFAKQKLQFAEKIARIWSKAKELDKKQNSEVNQNHFREQLRTIIQSDNKSILSRWVSIGQNAQALLPYSSALPPQRDSLYALSLAVKKNKPIQKWIDTGKLSLESTVREVTTLTKKASTRTSLIQNNAPSKTIDFLKITYPEHNAKKQFAAVRNELEEFLRSKKIPFEYCGELARYEKEMEKNSKSVEREALRLAKKYLKQEIKKRIEYLYQQNFHPLNPRNIPFAQKVRKLGRSVEDIDVGNRIDMSELGDLYAEMELNEDNDWGELSVKFYQEAISKCEFPEFPLPEELSSSTSDANKQITDAVLQSRKMIDTSKIRVI